MPLETFTDNTLTLELDDGVDEVRVVWKGKSNEREPGRFLIPVLQKALDRGGNGQKRVVLDFSEIEYMNSSTFTPVVKMLGEAARCGARVQVSYSGTRKWQALSFSALRAFETRDGRITVRPR